MMTRTDFPAGVMTAVVCIDGQAWLAHAVEGHWLVVWTWLEGQGAASRTLALVDSDCLTHGFPVLTDLSGVPTILYRVDRPEEGVISRALLPGAIRSPWFVPTEGMWPACWGPNGLMGVNRKRPYTVIASTWPNVPTDSHSTARPGAPTGISRFVDGKWVIWDEDEIGRGRRWTADGRAHVGTTHDDRIFAEIDGKVGILLEGENFRWPSISRQKNGALLIACHVENSNEALEKVVVLENVTADDLKPIEPPLPEPDVEPFGRAVPYFAYYTLGKYGDYYEEILHACLCMTAEDVVKANEQGVYVIAGPTHIKKAMKPALVMISNDYARAPTLEAQIPEAEAVARELNVGLLVLDDRSWTTFPSNLPPGTILAFKTWRSATTTAENILSEALKVTTRCQTAGFPRVCWVLGVDDRLCTLTDFQISETIQLLTSIFAELSNVGIVGAFSFGRVGEMPDGRPTGGGKIHPNGWAWIKAGAAASDPVDWTKYRLESLNPDPPKPPDPKPEVKFMNVYRYPKATEQPDKTDGMAPYYKGDSRLIGKVVMATRSDLAARGGFGIWTPTGADPTVGEWWSLNPDGNWERRPGTMENLRTWETFYKATPGMSAPREKSPGVIKVFLFDDIWFE